MRLAIKDNERCIGCQSCMFACARRTGEGGLAKTCIWVKSAGGMAHGFRVIVCRACADPPCARVCPTGALRLRGGGGVRMNPALCTGCRVCLDACILGAIFWDDENNKPLICVHCGYCVDYCPHDVLATETAEVSVNEGK